MNPWSAPLSLPVFTAITVMMSACGAPEAPPLPSQVDVTDVSTERDVFPAEADVEETSERLEVEVEVEVEPLDVTLEEVSAETGPEVQEDVAPPPACTDEACEAELKPGACVRARCDKGVCVLEPNPTREGKSCDDGDPCTILTICIEGQCTEGKTNTCDDLAVGPCERRVCDVSQGGCLVVPRDNGVGCEDGDPCTVNDGCLDGVCIGASKCDNGDVCDGIEVCEPDGTCTPGIAINCEDDDICNGLEVCDPTWGCVLGNPMVCDDGLACNGEESCHPTYGCVPGETLLCDDLDPCNGEESCDESLGCLAGEPLDCGLGSCNVGSGCWVTCSLDSHCAPWAHCDLSDHNNNGDTMECIDDFVDGDSCAYGAQCLSDYCDSGLCCTSGLCCNDDTSCPVSGDTIDQFQVELNVASGIARAVITPGIGGMQTFTAQTSGPLGRFSAQITVPPGQAETVLAELYSTPPPSQPGAELIASTSVVITPAEESPQRLDVVFEPPPLLIAGQVYGLALIGAASSATCGLACPVIWHGEENDPYPFGQVYRTYDAGAGWDWSPFGEDLWFEVTVGSQECSNNVCVQ